MNRLFKWLDGFRLKEYHYELPDKFNPNLLNNDILNSFMTYMIKSIPNVKCKEFTFGINNFIAEKFSDEKIQNIIEKKCKSVFTMKITHEESSIDRILINATIFTMCIDNHIWKFNFNVFLSYKNCHNSEYMTKLLVDYVNAIIDSMLLQNICKYKIHFDIDELNSSFDSSYSREFKARTTFCCMTDEFDCYGNTLSYNDFAPDYTDKEMLIQTIRRNTVINIPFNNTDMYSIEKKVD